MTHTHPSSAALGLGLAALGRPGYISLGHHADLNGRTDPDSMQAHAHAVLDAAYAVGIRWFDAARSYGAAEQFLAAWLAARAHPPRAVNVSSKWGYIYTADWQVDAPVHEIKDHTLANFQRQWLESTQLLGAHLKLYQIHSATLETGVLDDSAVLNALARLKEGGIAVGLSLSGAGQAATLERALKIAVDGVRLFDSVQATWNLLETSPGSALAAAHAAGMQVIVKEVLANGRLTLRAADDPALCPLLDAAGRIGCAPDALALAAALAQPWASLVLSGAATVAQIESHAAARALAWDDSLAAACAGLAESAEVYWAKRKALPWN